MKNEHPNQLLDHLSGAAASVTILFIVQAVLGFAVAAARPDLDTTGRHVAVACVLLSTLALFALIRVRAEPAIAAGIVATLLAGEIAGLAALVGIPALPLLVRLSFVVVVYGGLSWLAIAAVCATVKLGRARPTSGPIPAPPRLRGVDANRAA